jgi:hypothetical protein
MKTQHTRILNLSWPLRFAFTIAGFAFTLAPSHAQQLDPVKGPMTLQAPGPFYEGSKGGGTYGYSIKSDFVRVKSFSYADGETLKGKSDWVTASAIDAQASNGADSSSPQQILASVWDLVGGPGYYAAHVQGNKILHGTFTGDKGTVLEVESLDNFVAVGADNHGNLYKIVW